MAKLSRTIDMSDDETKAEVMDAVLETKDDSVRISLMLLIKVMDRTDKKIDALFEKIDEYMKDEAGIRAMVFNGHAGNHHDDHDYISEERIENENAAEKGLPSAKEIRAWARNKMADEKENAASRRRIVEGWIGKIGAHAITVLLTILGLGAYAYFH